MSSTQELAERLRRAYEQDTGQAMSMGTAMHLAKIASKALLRG